MLKKKIKDEKEEIESFYALLGFLLLIIAFLGGCFFGKVSLFIKMIVAFVVGDWYPIFLFMLLMYGIYLIVVRRPIDFFLEKYIGIYAIVISVLIISQIPFIKNMSSIDIEHFKLIEDTQLVVYRTINNIFNLWELEIFTLNFNLGGGVLAAFFSSLLVCFFTSKGAIAVAIAVIVFSLGTYILSFIKEKKKNKKKLAEAIIIEKRDNFEKIDEDKNIPEEEKTEASKVESIIEEKKDELTEELEESLYDEILDLIVEEDEVSIAFLQEKFRLGYNRASRCMTLLEKNGIVGPETESKTRKEGFERVVIELLFFFVYGIIKLYKVSDWMSKNFNVDFKGIKEIDFEKYHSLKNSIQTVSSLNQENINYGEADGFDYESYLSSRATDDEIIEEYKQLLLISIHYKEKFNETIHSLEKEKINLENIYLTYQEGYNAYLYSGEESLSFDEYVTLTYGTDYGQLGMTEEEYKKRLQEINQDLNALKPSSYLLTQKISEIPYLALSETQRFQEYEKKKLDTSYDSLKEIVYKKVEEYRYKHYTEIEDVPTTVNMIVDSFRFEDIPDEDRIMCFYLLENKGIVAVYDYVSAIKDKLNRNAGEKEASEFIESISNNGEVGATVLTIAEGTKDGLDDFVDGIYNVFAADGIITQNQYAEIYKMLALEEKGLLKLNYTGGRLLGNAAPSLLVSFGASRIISSTAGALAGNSSRGLSVMGNARNLALINGHSELESIIYGGILGLSDTTTGYYLSGLPLEISDLKDLPGFLGTATNLAFDKLAKVGIKFTAVNAEREVLNDWVDTGLISSVSNSNVDLVDIPEEVRKDFFLGYTKGKMFLKESIIKFTFNYTDYRLSFSAIFDYMNNHHVSFEEALVNVNFMKD